MLKNIKTEIVELHEWFTDWFNGSIDENEGKNRFINVLNKDFSLITPNGEVVKRQEIIKAIQKSYRSKSPEIKFKIEIENVKLIHSSDNYVLAIYNEVQFTNDVKTNRISSVLFKINEKLKNKLEWIHVHETWV